MDMRYEMLLTILSLILVGGITSVFAEFELGINELDASYGSSGGRYVVEKIEGEQIVTTDLGNIDVLLAPSPSVPQPKQFTNLHIIFLKPNTRTLVTEIDYIAIISKDGKELYSTSAVDTFTYSGFADVAFYIETKGKYLVSVSVVGVYEEDIPVETANFTLIVGNVDGKKMEEPRQPYQKTDTIKESKTIPDWIRNNAKWWSLAQISDQDFANGLEYLIKENIINVPRGTASEGKAEPQIPSWLRKNAGWWSQGLLADDEFLKSIQWLINNGFIKI